MVADRRSEQTFAVGVRFGPVPGYPEAELDIDFSATATGLASFTTSSEIMVDPFSDNETEIIEGFQLQLFQIPGSPPFTPGPNSTVLILDSDGR